MILSKESIKNIPPDKVNEFKSFIGKTATVLRRELENQSILVIRFEDDSVKTVCSSWVYSTWKIFFEKSGWHGNIIMI